MKMRISDRRSITIVLIYVIVNSAIVVTSLISKGAKIEELKTPGPVVPDFTEIENLNYFNLKNSIPQLSLSATLMKSRGEEYAEFSSPRGVYNYQKNNTTIRYWAQRGTYKKLKDILTLTGDVKMLTPEAEYEAQEFKYYLKKDLLIGTGKVKFSGEDLITKDSFLIEAERMRANPGPKLARFLGGVKGHIERKKKYEGKTTFSSQELQLDQNKSLAHLEGDVNLDRQNYHITAGKADIYLENFNKSLKYFVLNDDVKVTETLKTPQGVAQRKSYSERLEGFGREQKMILSGAPKVEQGTDVIKGYRIIIRENTELIEVDDAMSDVQVKRKEKLKE